MKSLPPLNALRAFEATARLGSVGAAADELHVTHGAVSRQLRTLERHFETRLFDKAGRGIALTAHGRLLHTSVGEAFRRLETGCATLSHQLSDTPFTLACPGSLLARWLIPRLDRLNADLPELRLRVISSETELDPRREDVDATLRFAAPPWPGDLRVIPLLAERIVAVATPDVWTQSAIRNPLAAIESLTLLDTASRPQAWSQWASAMAVDAAILDSARRHGRRFEHLYYLLEAALAGLGVAIAPHLLVESDLAQGRLVAPWLAVETDACLGLWLAPRRDERRGQQLANWLEKALADDAARE
ncbi:LysR family transcriptional regulator [Salinicola rhizosphaerae]|uniref:LysR family transcriptional regulator n=1 Tax=Salinicola rhizosphaerae TaxID=1443141 RepID=A0ABQ3DUK7_9GAMM|nr:LysR family transcriptional regulator [Salinicola rhizosphaerae]GHB13640.1 LysR family transcriptional regulator [Salinicola rhizosphaerae]